jgi:hypothetical protein
MKIQLQELEIPSIFSELYKAVINQDVIRHRSIRDRSTTKLIDLIL